MRTARTASVALALLAAGCQPATDPLPIPAPLRSQGVSDLGFPTKPRPDCTSAVRSALRDPDPRATAKAASDGANFTCGDRSEPTPLDEAVLNDAPAVVRVLLEAGADPNARWSSLGDRFPIQEIIEARSYGRAISHRAEITRLLLQHGADPNARWCSFESRGTDPMFCNSSQGVTPLIVASALDQVDLTSVLLDAGANARLEDWMGRNALDYAHGEAVFELMLPSLFPNARSRNADALKYLTERQPAGTASRPWDETPLANAIDGVPFPLLSALPASPSSSRLGRVKALLDLGADPNQRLKRNSADWTPLAMALFVRDAMVVETLLDRGANPNDRWCVDVRARGTPGLMAGCTRERGMTPLMFAASLGAVDLVRMLRRHGADAAVSDWQDKTAFSYATAANNKAVALALRER